MKALEQYERERKRYGKKEANARLSVRRVHAAKVALLHRRLRIDGSKARNALMEWNRVSRFVSRVSWVRGQGYPKTSTQ